jgi:FtsP/CotA-like multicopper oxidase with cupredoxin domain
MKGEINMRHKFLIFMALILVAAVVAWSSGDAFAQGKGAKPQPGKPVTTDDVAKYLGKPTLSEQKAAATRGKKLGLQPGIGPLAVQLPDPGGIPHYFGPYGNWAFSPLPSGGVAKVTIVDGGTGYTAPGVTIDDAYLPAGAITPATVSAVTVVNGVITDITISNGGAGYTAPVVTITDATGTGAIADATIGGTLTGGMRKFVDRLPGLGPANANNLGQYIPVAVADTTAYPGSDYYEIALVEYTEKMHTDLPPTRLRGYVQIETPGALAAIAAKGLPASKSVPLGGGLLAIDNPHYLGPIVIAQGRVRGLGAAGDPIPVRVKFYNLLPTGAGGDLFLPVDETIMGSGLGPAGPGTAGSRYTQNRAAVHLHGNNTIWISDGNVHQWITPANETTPYPKGVSVRNVPDMGTQCDAGNTNPVPIPGNSGCMTFYYTNAQSARLQFYHDHAMGITRLNVYAGQAAGYLLTDVVEQDLINGTNISGVNNLQATPPLDPGQTNAKVLPGLGIPLVIQDRTWVDASTIYGQDPTWNWGTSPGTGVTGDLWYPHVYMTVQNPWDLTGTNAFGRWHYGPWFNPPVPTCVNGLPLGCLEVGPVPNEYYQPDPLLPNYAPWEPPFRPGVPNPSIPGEAFMDTPIVNGTAYPWMEVEPKAYRFRILNAGNDRFLNLQLYVAADKTSVAADGTSLTTAVNYVAGRANLCNTDPGSGGVPYANCTEVNMAPISVAPANQFADWPSGIPDPDPTMKGPDWIMIGTEGGFMPKPVVVPQQPIGWNLNMAAFNFGVVNQHSIFLGSAERADVIVDFSAYAGKTLILYNDGPAPVPAGASQYDYYTGSPNQMDTGGAPTTQPGYGPNTRTIMQIRVKPAATTGTPDVTLANLEAVFKKGVNLDGTPNSAKRGVFEVSQDPILIPQANFNSAYNASFPTSAAEQYIQIAEMAKTFKPINYNDLTKNWDILPPITLPLEMKAMHDEMGGVYDTQFGRMSGMLGLTNPLSPVHVLIPYPLAAPPTDLVKGSLEINPIGALPDGTQIWRIFHNGVDTHPVHTHLFTAQLVNRLGQDGALLPIDPIELGWKDTFRVNPLEITYIAMRPTVPTQSQVPFEVPDSVRLIDPTLPDGATLIPPPPAGWFDPNGVAIPEILNHYVNFGWEYVWHCHILAHEEMDMMHSLVFAVPPMAPTGLSATWNGNANNPRITLNWTDNSSKEAGFTVQRATDANFTIGLTTFPVAAFAGTGLVTFTDTTVASSTTYWYRVFANGAPVGDLLTPGFPTMSADSVSPQPYASASTSSTAPAAPAAPTNLTATLQAGPQVSLTWRDNATNETYFAVERSINGGDFVQIATPGPRNNTGNVTYVDTTVAYGNTYLYQVKAVNSGGSSAYTNTVTVPVPAIPAAAASFTVEVTKANGNNYTAKLTWAGPTAGSNTWIINPPANFTIQRATNLSFTTGLSTSTVAGNLTTINQTVTRNTTYYYRIRANNSIGGSSAWTNALPFPIRTGN